MLLSVERTWLTPASKDSMSVRPGCGSISRFCSLEVSCFTSLLACKDALNH